MIFLKRYVKSIIWLYLSVVSKIPSQLVRTLLLRLLGMRIGKSVIYNGFHIRSPNKIIVGDGSVIGHGVTLDGRRNITIGRNVNISTDVMIWTLQHDYDDSGFKLSGGEVVVGDFVWISVRAIILPNVTIGEGAVVAAGAVVTKNVEPYTVVGGVPAKIISRRNRSLSYSPAENGAFPFI